MILVVLIDPISSRLVNAKRYPSLMKDDLADIAKMAKAYVTGGGSKPKAFVYNGEGMKEIPAGEC